MTLGSAIFGLTLIEIAVLLGAAGYVVSLAKDWRPVRALRADNHELRKQIANNERKIVQLEAQIRILEGATDLTVLQDEQRKIAEVLERVVSKLDSLDGAVRGNTAAVEAVARVSSLREALADGPERGSR